MFEIFQYSFIQNAIIAGLLISIISGIIGSLIVVNRMLFLAGGISHAVYGGVGIAIFFGLPIFLSTSIFAILIALLIAFLSFKEKHRLDIYIGLIWAFGMAFGIILIDLTPGYQADLMSYLFGSILAVSESDLIFMALLLVIILLIIAIYYRDILAVSYDSEFASLRGIKVKTFYLIILILSALSIVVAIRVVGLILVIALLSLPVYMAEKISNSLSQMMILASIFSLFFTIIGLVFSYLFNLTSGATIIMCSTLGFGIFLIFLKLFKK